MYLAITSESIWTSATSMFSSIMSIISGNVLFETIAIAGVAIPIVLGIIAFLKS